MRRLLAWALVLPVAAAGVVAGHALAYRLTGTPLGDVHDYLAHAPQIALVLSVVALAAAAFPARDERIAAVPVASVALVGFVLQEHLERIAHTGELPWLLGDPTFLVGLAIQVPVALACLVLARIVAGRSAAARRRPPEIPRIELALAAHRVPVPRPAPLPAPRGRGPPARSRP